MGRAQRGCSTAPCVGDVICHPEDQAWVTQNNFGHYPLSREWETAAHSCFEGFLRVEKGPSWFLLALCPNMNPKNPLPCLRHHLIQHSLFCLFIVQAIGVSPQL